jgi:glycosyltransferase involved in cell wall biosynthesis
MSGAHPVVSVVTPFYNTAAYLAQCIESVLAQTFADFEYILVDNHSTDGSTEIATRYACLDSRIRLVRTERLLSQVQNYNFALGLISPTSRWCKVVQADDWIAPECLERQVAVGDRSPRVGMVASFALQGLEIEGLGLPLDTPIVSGRDVCRLQLLEGRFLFGSPTAVLYRSSIVRARTPFYEEGRLHEDTELGYDILQTWDFGFAHQVLAFLRTDNGGLSSRAAAFNPHLLDKYIVLKRYGKYYLTPAEYERVMRHITSRYDRYIGDSALRRREPAFWAYHAAGLASIGEQLGRGRRARAVAAALAYHLTHPIAAIRWLWRRLA